MQPFTKHSGLVAPLPRANVDTDQIIPKQFLKSIKRTGFGETLFNDWRYTREGEPKPDFVLNQPQYQGATILATLANFGSGSSREHAAWAIAQYGFRVLIAPSFADIFKNNCYQNGILPVETDTKTAEIIINSAISQKSGYNLDVDLVKQTLADANGFTYKFHIDAFRKECLLNGLDDVALTLQYEQNIAKYEQNNR